MKKHNHIIVVQFAIIISTLLMALTLFSTRTSAQINTNNGPQVNTNNAGLVVKVAPGELLPISVKLANFGGEMRVDVLIEYSIYTETDKQISSSTETVAVETTASFIKNIQIPTDTKPGTYTAKTAIIYHGQLVPANSHFSFVVERKIFGIFQNEFIIFGGIIVVGSILLIILTRLFTKRARLVRHHLIDYQDIPKNERTFYEILSDIIMEMRNHVGDDALSIAASVNGMNIDKKTGRVLGFTDDPAKIIANLISEYEKRLGDKVDFLSRKQKSINKLIK